MYSSSLRPSKPPFALRSSTTIRATLALAIPTNESGPVWSAITPTLIDEFSMTLLCRAGPPRPCSRWESAVRHPPAHGEDPLGRRHFVLNQPALEGVERCPRPGGDADLGIQ